MKPLFEVGEEAVLITPHAGTHSVVIIDVQLSRWREKGKRVTTLGYFVSPDPCPNEDGAYGEKQLHKKPKGCGKSLDSLMTDLKRPATEPREVETV